MLRRCKAIACQGLRCIRALKLNVHLKGHYYLSKIFEFAGWDAIETAERAFFVGSSLILLEERFRECLLCLWQSCLVLTEKITWSSGIMAPIVEQVGDSRTSLQISLTHRLSGILKDYPENSVLKELLQNADDAGADEIRFCLDWRQHDSKRLAWVRLILSRS